MARGFPHSHLCHGQLVGFSVKLFAGESTYRACFRGPDGRRLKRDTNQSRQGQAVEAARLIIEEVYAPQREEPEKLTWDEVIVRLTKRLGTSGNRETTLAYYLKCLRTVRAVCGETEGPGDVTPRMAAAFRDTVMSTPTRRQKPPSAHYVVGLLGGLSAIWQKWFIDDLKLLPENPWADVEPPKADKLPVQFATDEMIDNFYEWIEGRLGTWAFPKLFLATKAYTGCRLMDLCALKSGQLRDGRLVFPAGLTKGRKERAVPLATDLFEALEAFKGEEWLWENYLPGLKAALEAKKFPTHKLMAEFSPQRLYFWVETLFADYGKVNKGPRLTTHMFRKRAFTLAWQKGVDARRASIAYGCNVDTLMRHYVQMDEQQVTDDVFDLMNAAKADVRNAKTGGHPE